MGRIAFVESKFPIGVQTPGFEKIEKSTDDPENRIRLRIYGQHILLAHLTGQFDMGQSWGGKVSEIARLVHQEDLLALVSYLDEDGQIQEPKDGSIPLPGSDNARILRIPARTLPNNQTHFEVKIFWELTSW